MSTAKGSCLCGGIQFELTFPSKWMAHCHCSFCRRAHGAGFVTWVGVEAAHFQLTQGAELVGMYRSSPEAKRSFCSNCGSPLFFESTRWPGEVHVAAAQVHDPLDRQPQSHVYFASKVPWIQVSDGLPTK